MNDKRKVIFFVPHYEDHERLKVLLRLSCQFHDFPKKFIIYDSSPNPIGSNAISEILPSDVFLYKELTYKTNENTYSYVLRDFLLSEDSNDGAFILPIDEFLLVDYELFAKCDPNVAFSCGSQLAFCPESARIAEYCLARLEGTYIASSEVIGDFSPQYHATYIPGHILRPLGIFMDNFLQLFGNKNSTYIDFVLRNLLVNLPIVFSKQSIYLQERLEKRKTAGAFVHPSSFIKKIDDSDKKRFLSMLSSLYLDIKVLPGDQLQKDKETILNKYWLFHSRMKLDSDNHVNLFVLKKENMSVPIKYASIDLFCGYHLIGSQITYRHIKEVFGERTIMSNKQSLECIRFMLDSY